MAATLVTTGIAVVYGLMPKHTSQITALLAFLPGGIALLATSLKLQARCDWHYKKHYALAAQIRKINIELPDTPSQEQVTEISQGSWQGWIWTRKVHGKKSCPWIGSALNGTARHACGSERACYETLWTEDRSIAPLSRRLPTILPEQAQHFMFMAYCAQMCARRDVSTAAANVMVAGFRQNWPCFCSVLCIIVHT